MCAKGGAAHARGCWCWYATAQRGKDGKKNLISVSDWVALRMAAAEGELHKGAYKNAAMVYVPPHPPHTCFSRSMRADQAGAFFMWAQSRACVLCLSHPFGLSRSSFLSFLFKTLRVSRVACGCALRLAQLLVRAGPAARQRGGGPRPGGGAQGHQVPHDVARRRAPPSTRCATP